MSSLVVIERTNISAAEKLRELKKTIGDKRVYFDELTADLIEFNKYMESLFPELVTDLENLIAEFNDLKRKEMLENQPDMTLEDQIKRNIEQTRIKNADLKKKNQSIRDRNTAGMDQKEKLDLVTKCKELYKKISKKTHPDVTNDEEKNQYFQDAFEAYNNFDLDNLIHIWSLVSDQPLEEVMGISVEEELETTVKEFDFVEDLIKKTHGSQEYQLFSLFNNPDTKKHSVDHFFGLLKTNYVNLDRELSNLRLQRKHKNMTYNLDLSSVKGPIKRT